jgi:hypothetical protein
VHVERCYGVGEMVRLGRPDDGCSDDGILQHPSQCHLSHRDAASFGDLLYRFDDGSVAFEIKSPSNRVDVEPGGVFAPGSGKPALGERRTSMIALLR